MEPTYPPVADRIACARGAAGLDMAAVATAIGLSEAAYFDLEAYDDEAFTCISLGQLCCLGQVLNVSPRQLVAPEGTQPTSVEVSSLKLVAAIRRFLETSALSVEQFEDEVGWGVSDALQNPETGCNDWCLDGLQDICRPLGLNWLLVLPNAPPNPPLNADASPAALARRPFGAG